MDLIFCFLGKEKRRRRAVMGIAPSIYCLLFGPPVPEVTASDSFLSWKEFMEKHPTYFNSICARHYHFDKFLTHGDKARQVWLRIEQNTFISDLSTIRDEIIQPYILAYATHAGISDVLAKCDTDEKKWCLWMVMQGIEGSWFIPHEPNTERWALIKQPPAYNTWWATCVDAARMTPVFADACNDVFTDYIVKGSWPRSTNDGIWYVSELMFCVTCAILRADVQALKTPFAKAVAFKIFECIIMRALGVTGNITEEHKRKCASFAHSNQALKLLAQHGSFVMPPITVDNVKFEPSYMRNLSSYFTQDMSRWEEQLHYLLIYGSFPANNCITATLQSLRHLNVDSMVLGQKIITRLVQVQLTPNHQALMRTIIAPPEPEMFTPSVPLGKNPSASVSQRAAVHLPTPFAPDAALMQTTPRISSYKSVRQNEENFETDVPSRTNASAAKFEPLSSSDFQSSFGGRRRRTTRRRRRPPTPKKRRTV